MFTYFSTFTSGLQEVIQAALRQQPGAVSIELLLDGLVLYQADASAQHIQALRFFNNSFLLLQKFEQLPAVKPVEYMMQAVLKKPQNIPGVPRQLLQNAAHFRIVTAHQNQMVSVERARLEALEKFFSFRFKRRVSRSKPDLEVWFLSRSEGYGFVGVRFTRTPDYKAHKGELGRELAHMLCWLSQPRAADLFLDPFAGYGAIPLERAVAFPYREVMAVEKEAPLFAQLQARAQGQERFTVKRADALNMGFLNDQTVDKIVTDPPWGFYGFQDVDLEQFYFQMLQEFSRVLKQDGRMVILTARKEVFEAVLARFGDLVVGPRYDILVSGKKAAIYVLQRLV